MGVTNIYLARHGETEFNRRNKMQGRGIDPDLNNTGLDQARAIAEYLSAIDLDNIYSSSLKRSRQTAEVVADIQNLSVESYKDLDEMNFGVFEGRSSAEIQPELEQLHNIWKGGDVHYASEGGESPSAVLDRAANRIQMIISKKENSTLLFVLHGRLIRILLSHFLGYGLSSMHRITHSNGALYHLQWDGGKFLPISLYFTGHLAPLGAER